LGTADVSGVLESSDLVEQLAGTDDSKLFEDKSSDSDLPCGWIITIIFQLLQNFWLCNTNCVGTIQNKLEGNAEEIDRRKMQNGKVIAQHIGPVCVISRVTSM
jgi:hypothetical protein